MSRDASLLVGLRPPALQRQGQAIPANMHPLKSPASVHHHGGRGRWTMGGELCYCVLHGSSPQELTSYTKVRFMKGPDSANKSKERDVEDEAEHLSCGRTYRQMGGSSLCPPLEAQLCWPPEVSPWGYRVQHELACILKYVVDLLGL
eukprot:957574-Pelagomonas_calceolata.AAC.6